MEKCTVIFMIASQFTKRISLTFIKFSLTKQAKINVLAANSVPGNIGQHAKDHTKMQKYIKFECEVQQKPTNYVKVLIINQRIHMLNARIRSQRDHSDQKSTRDRRNFSSASYNLYWYLSFTVLTQFLLLLSCFFQYIIN